MTDDDMFTDDDDMFTDEGKLRLTVMLARIDAIENDPHHVDGGARDAILRAMLDTFGLMSRLIAADAHPERVEALESERSNYLFPPFLNAAISRARAGEPPMTTARDLEAWVGDVYEGTALV